MLFAFSNLRLFYEKERDHYYYHHHHRDQDDRGKQQESRTEHFIHSLITIIKIDARNFGREHLGNLTPDTIFS